ncbi:alpha/beta hydrolase [Streptomyces sp. AJS327]|uniref:alpha/beta hydrolase n=1 Tax=Streptomyces sp. AJS327 TaxID=2545265 RepID=UPI0015DDF516|nr:alpha/beta hydrolase [Streptomyces sp. AJS327]MBA0051450.1 alpha/beta hydrolase [Streptomyces sp. AJS327]
MPIRGGRHTATRFAVLLTAVALLATGCSGDSGEGGGAARKDEKGGDSGNGGNASGPGGHWPGPGADGDRRIAWRSCPAPSSKQFAGGRRPAKLADGTSWQCGTLRVPLDHSQPKGATIGLAVIRAQAPAKVRGTDAHQGSLVFNFGGPGGSGAATLPLAADSFEALRAGYDLVSFDPRGVGESSGLRCLDDRAMDRQATVDASPDSAAEERALLRSAQRRAAACEKRAGARLPHLTTENTARDMDALRGALGEERLHYFGMSYGTKLGAVYAGLFPKRVGRVVLDAPVDPGNSVRASALGQAKGFQLAWENFLRDCGGRDSCPVPAEPGPGSARLATLLREADTKPLPTASGRKLTEEHLLTGVAAALYSQKTWSLLRTALRQAGDGRGDLLLALADSYTGRDQKGRYTSQRDANLAISCADSASRASVREVRAWEPEFRKASRVFGPQLVWGLTGCEGWPARGERDTTELAAKPGAPIVVLATRGDPATPYEGARGLTKRLGDGRLLTYEGEGHGAYEGGDRCVRSAVDRYLLRGRAPEDGERCG